MFDLSKHQIEVKCNCGRRHKAILQDVINQKILKCVCGASIKLEDGNKSVKKSVADSNRAFKDLEDTLRNLGK